MSGIFISYRRDDTQGFAGRLEDDLSESFGDDLIFRDCEIEPGEDFAERLRATLDSTDVVLAVVGPRWEAARDSRGQRRLEQVDDWVRIESETVLARRIPVVPVLVGGAGCLRPRGCPPASRSSRDDRRFRSPTFTGTTR